MTKNDAIKIIKKAKKIAMFAHVNPDPDAFGSMFAVREICQNLGKVADVFAIKNPKGYLDCLFPLEELKTDFVAKEYDLVILLDLHILSRVESVFREELEKCKNVLIIDHHETLEDEQLLTENCIIEPEKAATCEILTDLFIENNIEITSKVATYLWIGLIGDTGRFLHSNLSQNVLNVAKVLYEKGAEVQFVYNNMFRKTTQKQLKLQQVFIKKINFVENGKGAFAVFSMKDMKKLGIDKEDVKKHAGDMIRVDGVEVSFLCMEYRKNHYKFSVRSKTLNTVPFTSSFGGGGHECASGFDVDIKKGEIKKKAPIWIREILNGRN